LEERRSDSAWAYCEPEAARCLLERDEKELRDFVFFSAPSGRTLSAKSQETCARIDEGQKWVQEHFAPWAKSFVGTKQRSRQKEATDATNQAGHRGVWVTFQGIRIDTKLEAIQKRQALIIISEKKWWSDMEFLAHRLKSGRIEHTTITVRVLPNEPLQLCFMGMESSPDPDVTCNVQKSKNVLPETCSVLEPRGADALFRETMKAWHHLWHGLGATESQIQCLILLDAMHARRDRSDRSVVPKLPEITPNSLARAQRAVHWTNTTPLP